MSPRDGARGLRHAAADRRRDDQPRPHRGQDPSALRPRPDRPRQRRQPRRRRRRRAAVAGDQGRYVEAVRAEYRKVADAHARSEADKARLPLAKARANALKIDWAAYEPPKPSFLGARVFDMDDLADLARYIDWTPFFQTWELKGRYPAILDDEKQGEAARALFDDAQAMLQAHHRRELVRAARRWSASGRRQRAATTSASSPTTSAPRASSRPSSRCASSSRSATGGRMSRSPISSRRRQRQADYVGAFVVTAGLEEEAIAERFERANDDYSSILVKALADRFAEAFAEALHARVRRELWGYAPDEALHARRTDRRALSRHPPGARLSRPARPHREGDAVPPARRRARRSASR